jgi:ABC-2 type transport system ATP-binding protein
VLALVGLDARGSDRFGEYSFGMKQRLGIAAALLGDPALLVLDEPTNGPDPAGINEMRVIRSVGDGKRTVLVSSHILSELEQVCNWLIVIDRGSLVYQGPTQGFLDDPRMVEP